MKLEVFVPWDSFPHSDEAKVEAKGHNTVVAFLEAIGFERAGIWDARLRLTISDEKMTEWTKRTGMPNWNTRSVPTPRTIIELGRRDPTVGAVLELWKSGQIAWEQALMLAVCAISVDKDRYQETLKEMKENETVPFIVPMCKDPAHIADFMSRLKGQEGPSGG